MTAMPTPYSNANAAPKATVGMALRGAVATLGKTSTSVQLDAEILVMHITGFSRAELVTRDRHKLSATQAADLFRVVERRAAGEPIAYLTHKREFWSLELTVSPSTLIPRPETELLVEQALALIPTNVAWTIADLGYASATRSGLNQQPALPAVLHPTVDYGLSAPGLPPYAAKLHQL